MKILCINYEYPPIGGGGGVVCQGLADALARKGYSLDIVTSGMRGFPASESKNGISIHRVRCIRRHKHYATFPELVTLVAPLYLKALELVKKNNYILNHTHFIFPSGLVSYLLYRKTGLPYIIICHGSDVPGYNPDRFGMAHKMLRPVWHTVVRNSRGLLSPSNFLKQLIHQCIDFPVSVIPNGYDLPECQPAEKMNRILVVTRMFQRKGVQFFIDAVKKIDTDWEICIAGDGPYLETLKKLAEGDPRIQFLGFIQGQALIDLYNSARIFVFPSIQENFPVVLLEAMSAGCAIITSSASGCKEVVGDAGIITECGSVSDIRNALEDLLADESRIDRLSMKARIRAQNYSWDHISCQYDRVSRQVAESFGVQCLD